MNRAFLFGLLTSTLAVACGGSSQGPGGAASAGAGGSLGHAGSGAGADTSAGASGSTVDSGGATGLAGTTGSAGASVGGMFSAAGSAGSAGAGAGGSGGAAPTLGCAAWQVETGFATTGTATIVGGRLALARPAGSQTYDDGPTLTQAGLSGDFDITVSWQAFAPGDSKPGIGPAFNAGVFWHEPSGSIYSAAARVGGGTGQASIVHGKQSTVNSLPESATLFAGASGSFRLQRAGTSMTVTTTINGQAVSAQSTEPFPEQPLTLSLWMNDSSSSGAQDAGVTVTQVALSGGGGTVKPDDFSCP
ncbi:MAG: hypothetical protein ABI548_29685 [Polyangiaceae bacterium]